MAKPQKKHYKTLKGLMSQIDNIYLSATEIAIKRVRLKDRWYHAFSISPEAEDEFWSGIAKVVWKNPSEANIDSLRHRGKGWYMDRLIYNGDYYRYIGGQDYEGEIKYIQRQLR